MAVDAFGQEHARAGTEARIVSLVPSITELLFDLGLGAQLIGRTGFCVHPKSEVRKLTKIGGTKDVNLDAIRATLTGEQWDMLPDALKEAGRGR